MTPTTINVGQVSVGTTAILVVAENSKRSRIHLFSNADITVNHPYIGPDNTVTTSTGYPVSLRAEIVLESTSAIYAIASSSSVGLFYLEETD